MTHFFLSLILAIQEPSAPPASPMEKTSAIAPTIAAQSQSLDIRSSLLIDPKARAHDYAQAFELLRRERPTMKINIQTMGGALANVAELSVADNGTLLLIKVPYSQGMKYLVVPIEDIQEITYAP